MNKREIATIENIIARLRKPDLGGHPGVGNAPKLADTPGLEVAGRLYIDTWLIMPLELLVANEAKRAERMSRP